MKNKLNISIYVSIILACLGEFISCFIRGYSEFWLTILIVSLEIIVLASIGMFTKLKFFSLFATALGILGSILLIGFPSYIPYAALIFLAISLILEVVEFVIMFKNKIDN